MFLADMDTWEGKWANSMPWTVVTPWLASSQYLEDAGVGLPGGGLHEGGPPLHHLVDEDAQGPQVCFWAVPGLEEEQRRMSQSLKEL